MSEKFYADIRKGHKIEGPLSWTCPQCGKTITSLYQRQLDQNKKAHLDSCVQSDKEAKQ